MVKILGDRTLDEISNTRIFRLKQRTLPCSFDIAHLPGKTNSAADATSRHPSPANEFAELMSLSLHSEMDDAESAKADSLRHETHDIIAISWERIATETASDPSMRLLLDTIQEHFPDDRRAANDDIAAFWTYRDSLNVTDGVMLYLDRVVAPPSLRDKVLRILHSANQGVSSMESRARSIVFLPGMTNDIRAVREHCSACNRSAPSQAATHAIPSPVPSTPFESIFADFFDFGGCHYHVAGDRLSGWVEVFKAPHGTAQAGAQGLIAALRALFATFGVPEEISSDGGPEFSSAATTDFLTRWEVRHRMSSAYFPQSIGCAEVAVKKAKRMLMDNGCLNNDGLLRALLQARNTPDPDCNISPAQVVFGRPIRDAFSFTSRCIKYNNPSIRPTWHEAWSQEEDAMRARMPRTTEALDMHARSLAPLSLGDKVFLQNQRGSHPKKWDKSGTVVELGNYDQYCVKVDGCGRLTLRKRRFLRKFVPPSLTIGDPLSHSHQRYGLATRDSLPPTRSESPQMTTSLTQLEQQQKYGLSAPTKRLPPPSVQPTDAVFVPVPDCIGEGPTDAAPPSSSTPPATAAEIPPPVPAEPPSVRPRRQPKPCRHYVPATGKWQERWRSRCINTRLYTIYPVVWL